LVKKRNEINLTNSKLASLANISAVYLGEIINNKKNPPDKKTQYALAEALQLTEEEKIEFFNLAANDRGEIPVDVYDYLLQSEELLKQIRAKKNDRRIR
jgi:transcriptional regulator with XRE-family HTH domain